MKPQISLVVDGYQCDACTKRQGTPVRELVRMIPRAVIMNGKLVGDEWYCCPICFEPKAEVKTRRMRGNVEPERPKRKRKAAVKA